MTDPRPSVLRAAVTVITLIISLGGCTVTTHNSTPVSSKVTMILETGEGRFDLTRPPTREEAGMSPGRRYVDCERGGHEPFHVTVTLPEGRRLDLRPRQLGFDAYGARDSPDAPPTTLDIHLAPENLKDGLTRLLADASPGTRLPADRMLVTTAPRRPGGRRGAV